MPEETTPIPPPSTSGTTAAFLELVKNLQAGTQALQEQMLKDSKDVLEKCRTVAPLGGDFRAWEEVGYVLQYLRNDKVLRRKVCDFVKAEIDAAAKSNGTGSGAADQPK